MAHAAALVSTTQPTDLKLTTAEAMVWKSPEFQAWYNTIPRFHAQLALQFYQWLAQGRKQVAAAGSQVAALQSEIAGLRATLADLTPSLDADLSAAILLQETQAAMHLSLCQLQDRLQVCKNHKTAVVLKIKRYQHELATANAKEAVLVPAIAHKKQAIDEKKQVQQEYAKLAIKQSKEKKRLAQRRAGLKPLSEMLATIGTGAEGAFHDGKEEDD